MKQDVVSILTVPIKNVLSDYQMGVNQGIRQVFFGKISKLPHPVGA